MSRSLNRATLLGNLGRDPEVRTTASGKHVAHLAVATEREWTDREGAAQKRVEWHRVVVWDGLAEIAERFLSRGERVLVEGEIRYRSYDDGEGNTRYVTEIHARELVMLGSHPGAAEPVSGPAAPRPAQARVPAPRRPRRGEPLPSGSRNGDDPPF